MVSRTITTTLVAVLATFILADAASSYYSPRMGRLNPHYWNDTVHGVAELGRITELREGPFIDETIKRGD